MPMNAEAGNPDWKKIKEIFHEALRREPKDREIFLNESCDGDLGLRLEVESLLFSLDQARTFLEEPAFISEPGQAILWQFQNGEIVSHYRIVEPIGAGGMGQVYLAEDQKLHRQVALKILPAEVLEDIDRLRRFKREALAISALNHPNILTIFEFDDVGGVPSLASEYVRGTTLRDALKNGPLEIDTAIDIAMQVASALQTAHDAGVIHRDIKPENIMIRDDRYVKVLDFGLAKLTGDMRSEENERTHTQAFSLPGIIMGTAAYMSPEQARSKSIDPRTDIFSFGVVLYEMLAGRPPFAGETATDIIAEIIQKEPASASLYNSAVPVELDRIVNRCLEKDRKDRYQKAADLLVDLREFSKLTTSLDTFPNSPTETQPTQVLLTESIHRTIDAPRMGPFRKLLWPATLLSVILIFGIAGYYWFVKRGDQINSIAVMPFTNESGNADIEYLSDGMTDSLINTLSTLPNLSVKARNSVFRYKGAEIDGRTIGQDLSVQALLLGRITQRGDNLTLHLSLIDAGTGRNLWGEQYDRKMQDLAVLQREITRDVSQKLRNRLSSADASSLTKNQTENAEAYQLYLRGRYFRNKRTQEDFEKSREYFQRAIDLDPNYALAYSGLAEYYSMSATLGQIRPSEAWPKQEAIVRKALQLDPNLAEAVNSLASLKRNYYRDWAGAERDCKRAIELDPNYAEARAACAGYLSLIGRLEEAYAERKRAVELDPLSPSINFRLAVTLFHLKRYSESIAQYRATLELDPTSSWIHERLGDAYEQNGMPDPAIAEWSNALTLLKENDLAAMLKEEYRVSGFDKAVRLISRKRLERMHASLDRGDYIPAMRFAQLYMRLGNRDQTLFWLGKSADEINAFTVDILHHPIFDGIRSEPRFLEVVRRIGLPQ